jgi:hypothetical protein
MILRLLVVVLIACLVFWLIRRALPTLRRVGIRGLLPLLMNPLSLGILRRALSILIRFILRR